MLYEVPAPNPYEIRILGQSRHIKKEALFYKGVGEKKDKHKSKIRDARVCFLTSRKNCHFIAHQKFSRFIKWLLTYETLGGRRFIKMFDRL
jgi:hypothetical protein